MDDISAQAGERRAHDNPARHRDKILVFPLGCARRVYVGRDCGAKLPLLSVYADAAPLKGDGTKKKKAHHNRETKVALVISENFSGGCTRAKLYYKCCGKCKLLHFHDHAERCGVVKVRRTRRSWSTTCTPTSTPTARSFSRW